MPAITNKKLGQQFVGPLKVIRRIGRLAYELDIPSTWKIHLVISVVHLEPASTTSDDPYGWPRPDHPESVYVEGDTENSKSYELQAIVGKRFGKDGKCGTKEQYLIRWKDYGPEWDQWMDRSELDNAKELLEEYAATEGKRKGRRTTKGQGKARK